MNPDWSCQPLVEQALIDGVIVGLLLGVVITLALLKFFTRRFQV